MSRKLILHHHLFKNAGSSVDAILAETFGPALGFIEGPQPWSVLEPAALLDFVAARPDLAAVSSHQARLIDVPPPGLELLPILLLRHPIDRARSVYDFARRQTGDLSRGARVAQSLSFADYVLWRAQPGNGAVISNFQTVVLAATATDMRVAVAGETDLDAAKARLARLPTFGLVERFDESLARFRAWLAGAGFALAEARTVENQTPGRPSTLQARLERIRADLGEAAYAGLVAMNRLDLELHAHAQALFDASAGPEPRAVQA